MFKLDTLQLWPVTTNDALHGTWWVGKEWNQQTPKNGHCVLIPNTWWTPAITRSSQWENLGRIPSQWKLQTEPKASDLCSIWNHLPAKFWTEMPIRLGAQCTVEFSTKGTLLWPQNRKKDRELNGFLGTTPVFFIPKAVRSLLWSHHWHQIC